MKFNFMKYINKIKGTILDNKKITSIVVACLIVLITILVIASCIKEPKQGNSTGNSYNNGIATQEGSWIYYIEMDNSESIGICKVKQNGKHTKKISDGKYMRFKCYRQLHILHRKRRKRRAK